MPETELKSSPNAIDLREAVSLAAAFCRQLYPETTASNVLVEEVDETPDGTGWSITLGFDTIRVIRPPSPLFMPVLPREEMTRVYKTFSVDSATRRVVSMRIRKPV